MPPLRGWKLNQTSALRCPEAGGRGRQRVVAEPRPGKVNVKGLVSPDERAFLLQTPSGIPDHVSISGNDMDDGPSLYGRHELCKYLDEKAMDQVKEQEDILNYEQAGVKHAVLTVYFGHEHRRFLPRRPLHFQQQGRYHPHMNVEDLNSQDRHAAFSPVVLSRCAFSS